MPDETRINLTEDFFGPTERTFLRHGGLTVGLFQYSSGVRAMRLRGTKGEIVVLPFQGQQVWDATFEGRRLTMKAMRQEPIPTQSYLEGFGAFLVHCGITAMGVPGPTDTHPLHGELHHARFSDVSLAVSEDARGRWISIGGAYRHTVAFACDFVVSSRITLYEQETLFDVRLELRNLKGTVMEYMYMAHPDFRPVDNGRFVYSARCNRENVRVRRSIPPHMKASGQYANLLDSLSNDPQKHHILRPGEAFDPEVVSFIDRYIADVEGWAHSMLVHPDGFAFYVGHRPSEFDHVLRWICRTPDQDCLGIALPATAEPEGYSAEKAKGNVKTLAPGESRCFNLKAGLLCPPEARALETKIGELLATNR